MSPTISFDLRLFIDCEFIDLCKVRGTVVSSTDTGGPNKDRGLRRLLELSMSRPEELAKQPEDLDLIEQRPSGGDFATPEIAAAWMSEIENRARAYERGETLAED